MRSNENKNRGFALLIVLWVSILLTVLISGYSMLSHTETLQSRFMFDDAQAKYMALAGIERAVFELRKPDLETRWQADGRPYEFDLDDAVIEVKILDETGKVDINAAPEQMLMDLFASVGVDEQQAQQLTDAIQDWRDPDDLARLAGAEDDDYESAGYPYGAKDAPFDTVEELQQVMGMNYELFTLLEPSITVFSGRSTVNAAFAPLSVLRALPGMDPDQAQQFIDSRQQVTGIGTPLPQLPDGTQPLAQGGGLTYSIRSRATLANGAWAEVEQTIRHGGTRFGRPFRVLRIKDPYLDQEKTELKDATD